MAISRFDKKVILTILYLFSVSFLLSLALMQLIAALLFLMWIFERWEEKKKTFGLVLYAVFIFGIIRVISILLSEFPSSSYQSFYKEAIFYTTAISLSFYYKTLYKDDLIKLFNIFIIGAIIISSVGTYKFYSGEVERAQSFSGSYTVFSSYLLVALSFSLFFSKNLSSKKMQLLWSFVYLILLLGIVTSLGRANLFIALVIFLIAIVMKQLKPFQLITIIIAATIFLTLQFIYPSEKIEQRTSNITQLSDRDIIILGALKIIFDKPIFGYGPRTFSDIFPLKDKFQDKGVGGWHNDFLQIYFESGVIGLLSFLLLIYIIFKELIKLIRNENISSEFKSFAYAILFSVISLLLTSFFSGFITSTYISVVFIFLISLIDRLKLDLAN